MPIFSNLVPDNTVNILDKYNIIIIMQSLLDLIHLNMSQNNNQISGIDSIENIGQVWITGISRKLWALVTASVFELSGCNDSTENVITSNNSLGQWRSFNTIVLHQDLIDWYVWLILKEKPGANEDSVREIVKNKLAGLTAQEPFFLRAVLESDIISDGDKLGMYIGVRNESDPGERYPHDYHMYLIKKTEQIRSKVNYK